MKDFAAPISEQIWNLKYRLKNHDGTTIDDAVQDTWRRVAKDLASVEKDLQLWEDRFYEALEDFKFLPAGRITAGAGTGRDVTLFNCFVMGTVPDSMSGIMDGLKEAALTMQQGGGIGYDFSTIRPKGAEVKGVSADASGPLTFMDVWDTMCKTIMSAGSRRGAMMATMRCDHPDVQDFIEAKKDPLRLRNFNLSVLVTDAFMEAVEEDAPWELVFDGKVYETVKARDLWNQIMQSTYDYAEPGVIFIDRINDTNNLHYCETIAATNPCFTGDTLVWTSEGPVPFSTLAKTGKNVEVLTQTDKGHLVYRTMRNPRVTRRQASLVQLTLDNGTQVRCTPNHEFFTRDGQRVQAQDLQEEMSISSVYRRKANQKGYMRLCSTSGDQPLEHHVAFREAHADLLGKSLHVHHRNRVKNDNKISNLEVMDASEHNSIHMRGNNNPSRRFPERNQLIQRDHSGQNNGRYREDLDDSVIAEMRENGMSYSTIAKAVGASKYTVMKRLGWERPNHKVVSVEHITDVEDVYCGTVDDTGRFFIDLGQNDGVLVSNCGEQPLPPYGACLLGSINLSRFVKDPFSDRAILDVVGLEETVRTAIRMLDNVVDASKFPLQEQWAEAYNKRRLGLGVTGVADFLAMMKVPYGSDEAEKVLDYVLNAVDETAYVASTELAEEKGPFPLFDDQRFLAPGTHASTLSLGTKELIRKRGIRNSHLTSIAPTGTISLYAGNVSSGIEPIFAFEYDRKVTQKDGTKTTELVQDYAVQLYRELHGDGDLPDYFVSAQTLSPLEHVKMQAVAQKWIDSSISKTINCPEDISFEDFKEVYLEAYRTGCKGCTTYRPNEVTGSVLSVTPEKPKEKEPLAPRAETLSGKTYKLKWPEMPHAFYVTINDDVDGKPFEILITTQNVEAQPWIAALTRMISAVFRRKGDLRFVSEELRQIYDPRGGHWMKGKYVKSLVSAIGDVIADHTGAAPQEGGTGSMCPSCGEMTLVKQSGCETCTSCGFSRCG